MNFDPTQAARAAAHDALDALERLVQYRLHSNPYDEAIDHILQVLRPGLHRVAAGLEHGATWWQRLHEQNPGGLFSPPRQLHAVGISRCSDHRLFEVALAYPDRRHPEVDRLKAALAVLAST
ncbi:hypothetical protein [Ramlibacter albus]|uniref:Uncharacterized protein n=1 Tax=Ramlibacter albus TaxID=2079448 RepID=A0A923M5D0_9BURK|nr:hypothetical protein [Ramlibacter albus]MBC5764250.1 hypothetical protein [Ramlibacter albus]